MSNPLHKNKVIQFIKRYPNSEDFVLTTGNTPLSQGNSNTFTPGCTVGLSGQAGNPANFTDLIDMWVAGGLTRNNINPYGLMRLWAAAYRTYYHWCKTVKRPYFNPVGSTVTTRQRLLNLDEYEVRFTSNLNTASVKGTNVSGALAQGKQVQVGSPLSGLSRREITSTTTPEVRTDAYIPSVLYTTSQITEGSVVTTLVSLPVGAIGLMYGGPIKCELLFNNAVDVEFIEIPNTSYRASPSTPEGTTPFNWFFPSNFELRASYDGITYSNSFKYSSIISSLNQTVSVDTSGGPFDWRQIIEAQISSTSTSLLTALNNISNYSSSVNSKANLENWFADDPNPSSVTSLNQTTYGFPNDAPFSTRIKSITSSSSGYDLSQFIVGRPLKGHEVEVVTVMQGSTPKTCIVRTWFRQNSIPRKLSGSATQLIPLEYETNSLFALNYGYFEVVDISNTGGRILTGTCDSPILFKGLKALEITSGINDGLTLRPYIVSFPRVVGSIKSFTTTINTTVNSNYTPNYSDSYWTNNSPESFTIGTTNFSDEIARNAFLTVNYTGSNVDKWKRLPYTLPNTGVFLNSQINSSSLTVRELPIDFDYNEDYLNNKIIPLPTNQELIDYETEALQLGRDPVVHYFRRKFSDFLLELINYCKTTCLKFWQYSYSNRSVINFTTYTTEVLQFDNITLPLETVVGSAIKVYEINTTGSFDIETNDPAKRLWFLSGGGATRVDIDIAVLQQLLSISGITL